MSSKSNKVLVDREWLEKILKALDYFELYDELGCVTIKCPKDKEGNELTCFQCRMQASLIEEVENEA